MQRITKTLICTLLMPIFLLVVTVCFLAVCVFILALPFIAFIMPETMSIDDEEDRRYKHA